MWKNMKLAVRTSILMVLVLIVGFVALWKTVESTMSNILDNSITNQMMDAVKSRSEIIENYVKMAEDTLITYGLSEEVVNLLNDPDNEEKQQIAQDYTDQIASTKVIFEGLYIADYNTKVLAHNNKAAVGNINRAEGESRTKFQNSILATNQLTNGGIMKSPSSGEMVVSMYYPVFQNGSCIGFVGAAVYAKNLMDSLLSLKIEGLPTCEYVFLNVANGYYLYNEDPELLCTETTISGYQEIIQQVQQDGSIEVGIHSYLDENGAVQMVIYRYLAERGWIFALRDSSVNMFSAVGGVEKVTGALGLAVGVIVLLLLLVLLSIVGKQLNLISKSIGRLGQMDLTMDDSLKKYLDRGDEIGIISNAISNTCNNLDVYISEVDEQLSAMAQGDFSKEMKVEFIGKFKNLEESMINIQSALRDSFREIRKVTSELVVESNVVAENANVLAETSVSASQLILDIDNHVEELSTSVSNSAESAASSKIEMDRTTELVSNSQEKMTELTSAMEKIADSASAIDNISKDMENIAKQTNILALNALVEAGRAGESGKGFGVVANEIRSLALQSNEAATKATDQINLVLECIREGIGIGKETSEYLETVVAQTQTIDGSISSIADVTKVQNERLQEVRNRLHEMNKTIENNAAMAEQSSAASSELDDQIVVLKDNIARYHI